MATKIAAMIYPWCIRMCCQLVALLKKQGSHLNPLPKHLLKDKKGLQAIGLTRIVKSNAGLPQAIVIDAALIAKSFRSFANSRNRLMPVFFSS